jgi:hypothetical protein
LAGKTQKKQLSQEQQEVVSLMSANINVQNISWSSAPRFLCSRVTQSYTHHPLRTNEYVRGKVNSKSVKVPAKITSDRHQNCPPQANIKISIHNSSSNLANPMRQNSFSRDLKDP